MEFFVPDSVKEIDWILNLPDKLEELFLHPLCQDSCHMS
jgi:hypothetical protein